MTDRDRPTKPPEAPRAGPPRPRQGSAPRLVVREEVQAGAVRQPGAQPPPAPKRARVEADRALPPPPPTSWREEVTGRAIPHPLSDHPPRSQSPPPFELAESPSAVTSSRELAELKAELQDAKERADQAEAAQLELQAKRPARVWIAPVELDPPPPRRSHALLKAAGIVLGGALVTVSGYFGIGAKTQLEPKVDATKAVQVVTIEQLKVVADRVDALEQRDRQRGAHDACVERQDRDAHLRGTGHDLTSEPRGGTDWAEQRKPSSKPHQPGEPAVYFTTEACPAAPP